ncbi:unnamed protein product [Protopolystoma xenopodis]|uniref:Uncharacterized protein n=1 Tax=Protopolystoma xenopodis TaxID=117903 RepID=A0A3S5CB80_9PLAT|nr:unnamed protein product [Protopolystoma xenopodis]
MNFPGIRSWYTRSEQEAIYQNRSAEIIQSTVGNESIIDYSYIKAMVGSPGKVTAIWLELSDVVESGHFTVNCSGVIDASTDFLVLSKEDALLEIIGDLDDTLPQGALVTLSCQFKSLSMPSILRSSIRLSVKLSKWPGNQSSSESGVAFTLRGLKISKNAILGRYTIDCEIYGLEEDNYITAMHSFNVVSK